MIRVYTQDLRLFECAQALRLKRKTSRTDGTEWKTGGTARHFSVQTERNRNGTERFFDAYCTCFTCYCTCRLERYIHTYTHTHLTDLFTIPEEEKYRCLLRPILLSSTLKSKTQKYIQCTCNRANPATCTWY